MPYPTKHSYEVLGFATSKEIITYLSISIPCLIIGIILLLIANKNSDPNSTEMSKSNNVLVSISMLLCSVGGLCLIPLISYIELFAIIIGGLVVLFFIIKAIISA